MKPNLPIKNVKDWDDKFTLLFLEQELQAVKAQGVPARAGKGPRRAFGIRPKSNNQEVKQ